LIRHAIEHGEVERLPEIIAIVRRTGALEATRAAAEAEADPARDLLACTARFGGPRGSARIMCSVCSPLFLSLRPWIVARRRKQFRPPSGCSLAW
jgi:hypothetical protein